MTDLRFAPAAEGHAATSSRRMCAHDRPARRRRVPRPAADAAPRATSSTPRPVRTTGRRCSASTRPGRDARSAEIRALVWPRSAAATSSSSSPTWPRSTAASTSTTTARPMIYGDDEDEDRPVADVVSGERRRAHLPVHQVRAGHRPRASDLSRAPGPARIWVGAVTAADSPGAVVCSLERLSLSRGHREHHQSQNVEDFSWQTSSPRSSASAPTRWRACATRASSPR